MTASAKPELFHRYPGAQPFQDNDVSRQTFFGRKRASDALANQILASRLVIVYARSGSGKTSLLNAGVAPRLRDAGCVPLFVRVNDLKQGPTAGVLEGIQSEVIRQGIEYVPGESSSLWAFFKTAEFWREDILLRPVLIVDQFEELFTLQQSGPREHFLSELGALLRGDAPPGDSVPSAEMSASPPVIHVVLSLREDFLGLLEEASEQIPEIMDTRFRLTPLTAELARTAITGPAAVKHDELTTQAFELTPECVDSIIAYLSRSTLPTDSSKAVHVEPFHLQLICQHIESIAQARQALQAEKVRLSLPEIGGEQALGQTLKTFYTNAIRSLPKRYRRKTGRMCEQFLISREGRRLSVDERELCRGSGVTVGVLHQLVDCRLLRTDRRSDYTYYELGHDTLVQPVLATRRMGAFLLYRIAIFAGSTITLAAVAILALMVVYIINARSRDSMDITLAGIGSGIALAIGFLGRLCIRSGSRRRARFRQQAVFSAVDSESRVSRRKQVLGWILLIIGPPVCLAGSLFLLVGAIGFSIAGYIRSHPGSPADVAARRSSMFLDLMNLGPLSQPSWWVLEYSAVVMFGWFLFSRGDRMLWPDDVSPGSEAWRSQLIYRPLFLIKGIIKLALGLLAANIVAMGMAAIFWCDSLALRAVSAYVRFAGLLSECIHACQDGLKLGDWLSDRATFTFLGFTLVAFVMMIVWLWTGVADFRRDWRLRRNTPQAGNMLPLLVLAVLILIFLPLLKYAWASPIPVASDAEAWAYGPKTLLHTTDGGRTWNELPAVPDEVLEMVFTTPASGWAAGKKALWHTVDGGRHWTTQPPPANESSPLIHISFATPQLGMGSWSGSDSLATTSDGGVTWIKTKPMEEIEHKQNFVPNQGIDEMSYVAPQYAVIRWDGDLWKSTDGGLNWMRVYKNTDHFLFGFSFANPEVGWATDWGEDIWNTSDGGTSWQKQRNSTSVGVDLIAALSPSTALACDRSETGKVLRTEDGTTWSVANNPIGYGFRIRAVAVGTPLSAWAITDYNVILHTDDAGHTWNLQKVAKQDLQGLAVVKK